MPVNRHNLQMVDGLLPYLPRCKILAAFQRSPGDEFGSGKFFSRESSAALAANTFGLFIDRPRDLPAIPGTEECGWPATHAAVEECARFPWWPRGRHPWLDALIETPSHIIGIESKRYEPYRSKTDGKFSKTYWQDVWGDQMGPYERMRDRLAAGDAGFRRIDAAQLVKHAFGLRTEGQRRGKATMLVYLFAEPEVWGDGRPVNHDDKKAHVRELERFAAEVAGAEVIFEECTYQTLLATLRENTDTRDHADLIEAEFRP